MAFVYTEISKNKFKSILLLLFFIAFLMIFGFIIGEATASGGGIGGLGVAGIIAVVYGLIG